MDIGNTNIVELLTPKMEELLSSMSERNLAPLWDIYEKVVTREPRGMEPSHLWEWETLVPALKLAGESVTGKFAERRVLLLAHPFFADRIATTHNLLSGVQCVLPGEKTTPHRHSATDVRFVLEGNAAETTVDGKVCPLNRGDLILTPGWTWHGHTNQSNERVVWMDTLDMPLVGKLGASFHDPGPVQHLPHSAVTLADESYAHGGLVPVTDHSPVAHSPRVRWPIAEVLDTLQWTSENVDGSRTVRYTDPVSGGAITPTLDVYALELHARQPTHNYRNTGSTVCVVIDGEGETRVGDQVHTWTEKDIFTLPNWTWRSHQAHSKTAHLLQITDRELFRRAGLYREQLE